MKKENFKLNLFNVLDLLRCKSQNNKTVNSKHHLKFSFHLPKLKLKTINK